MLRAFFVSLLSFVLLCSCAFGSGSEATTALLAYEDFGPPSMANELLGMDWWQWQTHGDSRPKKYGIKVVVHRNISLDAVKKKYRIDPKQDKDFRYAEYAQAVSYLDRHIAENAMESVTARLQETKAKIVRQLGPP